MNGDQDSKLSRNSNRFPGGAVGGGAGSDEDYEDVEDGIGSGVEDDAPESFQALNRSDPPWATFPDLLRVPTSSANNAATEDDSPESLSFSAAQSSRSHDLANNPSGYRPTTANPLPSSFSAANHVSFVGEMPNRSHPDVSNVNQSNSVSASSRNYPNSNCSSRQGLSISNSRPLPALPNSLSRDQPHSNDCGNRIAHHPHRNPINSLNLSSALYSASNSPPLSSSSSSSATPSLAHSLAPITNALTRVQSSVDALSRQVNEKLDALENRLNHITASSTSNGNCTVNSSDPVNNSNRLEDISPESMKRFINEQKREMHNERRAFLLSFADALRNAVETSNQSPSSSLESSCPSQLNGL